MDDLPNSKGPGVSAEASALSRRRAPATYGLITIFTQPSFFS